VDSGSLVGRRTPKRDGTVEPASSQVSPEPRHAQPATILLFLLFSLCLSTWALLGVTGVAPNLFYHVCWILSRRRRGWLRRGLVMVTDGANVLSVRSRTTRSSKGKVSLLSSLFSFNIYPDLLHFLLQTPHLPHVLSFLFHPILLSLPAPLRPRNKHTTAHGTTPSARPLRGRHNRRRKLPFPRSF